MGHTAIVAWRPIAWSLLGLIGAGLSIAVSPDARGLFGAALALLMLAIAISDARSFVIPDRFSITAFALALVFAAWFDGEPFPGAAAASLLRAAVTALPFFVLMVAYERLRGRPGLGLGDVKLAAVAGAWLDWYPIILAIEAAALAALAVYGVRRYLLHRPLDPTTAMPFGAFFAPAIWLSWLRDTAFLSQ